MSPRLELLFAATQFCNVPAAHADRLKAAGERYLKEGATTDPYTMRLARAAIAAGGATPIDRTKAVEPLHEVLRLAFQERRDLTDDNGQEQLIEAGARQWQERADLK